MATRQNTSSNSAASPSGTTIENISMEPAGASKATSSIRSSQFGPDSFLVGGAGMTKGSRVPKRKKLLFKAALGESENAKRLRELRCEIRALIRQAKEDELMSAESMFESSGDASDGTAPRFPRQVAQLGGRPPKQKCVPRYVKAQALSPITKKTKRFFLAKTCLRRQSTSSSRGVNKSTKHPIPERLMTRSCFSKWYSKEQKTNKAFHSPRST